MESIATDAKLAPSFGYGILGCSGCHPLKERCLKKSNTLYVGQFLSKATNTFGISGVVSWSYLLEALKSADVTMNGWEKIGSGIVTGFFTGDVAAVKAAVEAGADAAGSIGEVIAVQVIPRPHDDLGKLGSWIG